MTKLTKQDLPRREVPFHHCKSCKEWVPFKEKHNKKIHPNGAFLE